MYKPDLLLAAQELDGDHATTGGMSEYEVLLAAGRRAYSWRRKPEHPHVVHPDLAVLPSKSGSTGSPKLVRLSRKNVKSNAQSICQALNITSSS
jgi:long-subunit acyl-CoA synthetase (AMP-forming)